MVCNGYENTLIPVLNKSGKPLIFPYFITVLSAFPPYCGNSGQITDRSADHNGLHVGALKVFHSRVDEGSLPDYQRPGPGQTRPALPVPGPVGIGRPPESPLPPNFLHPIKKSAFLATSARE